LKKEEIFREVERIVDNKRTNMKIVFEAIEKKFSDIAIVAVDKNKDTIIFGFEYIDEQDMIFNSDNSIGGSVVNH
jgi:hypothetical protein